MDKILVRNFLIFVVILLTCAGMLLFTLIQGDRELVRTDNLVLHTHSVITEAERLSSLVEGMLSEYRAYLLTGQKNFLAQYQTKKAGVAKHIANLGILMNGNPSQEKQLHALTLSFHEFSKTLEALTQGQEFTPVNDNIEAIKHQITRIHATMLQNEYALLKARVTAVEDKKGNYFLSLVVGVVVSTLLLILFHAILLQTQRKRSEFEASLKDSEERFALAIEGTQDGIFDWDIKSGNIFYSSQFFKMLGYDRKAFTGNAQIFWDMVHPDDLERVREYCDLYCNGELAEYSQAFRMQNAQGGWVWIQSRAKAIYDRNGKALRLVGAHTDISIMKEYQEQLKFEKRQAETANQAKSDFLAHMSHEIRTPLTAISGIAEIFDKNKSNFDDRQKQLIKTLRESTSSLKILVDDVLDFSKIEAGELEMEKKIFNIHELFQEMKDMLLTRAGDKGIAFEFDYSSLTSEEFYGDPRRLRQILINLIGNAVKFTEKGSVTVKLRNTTKDARKFLRVDVTDTGVGIDPAHFDLIFERFKQADSSVSRKYGGTGLGLSISRNLARLMGGDILLTSERNKGSTFSLLIPTGVLPQTTEHGSTPLIKDKVNDIKRFSNHVRNKILIVEDYEGSVVILGYILDDLGCLYDIATTGRVAVDLWERNHYDIVLMDIQMPEMDGFAATRKIRHLEKERGLAETPIIGMTAHALVGDKDKCIEAGMNAYLSKPIVEADLKQKILFYLAQNRNAA